MYYWYYNKPSERKKLKESIYDIDQDIIKILFSFDDIKLYKFFLEYEKRYGASAAKYAKKVFNSWKCRATEYSAKSIRRFISIVPRMISSSERYDLTKKLYEKSKKPSAYFFEVILGDNQALSNVTKVFNNLCEKPFSHNLGDKFKNQMNWLCDNDSVAANKLLSGFDSEYSLLISKAAKHEINNLVDKISNLDNSVVGTHDCVFPFGKVTIVVRQPTMFEKIVRSFK